MSHSILDCGGEGVDKIKVIYVSAFYCGENYIC